MSCKTCGMQLGAGSVFCANCGTPVAAAATPPPAYPKPSPPYRAQTVAEPAAAIPYPGAMPQPQFAPPQFAAPQFAAPQYVPLVQQAAPLYVTCLSGPDAGKFYTVAATEAIMGRSTGIGQTDGNVAPQHVAVSVVNQRLRFRALTQNPIFINAQPFSSGELLPGQEFRLGLSIWKVNVAPGQQNANIFHSMQEQLNRLAGTEKLEGFSLREMFSEVFKKRSAEELEDYLTVGTYRTTPPIDKAQTGWPKPWLFLRVLVAVMVAYFGFTIIMTNFHNTKAVPAVILMGSLAVPLATVLLFFELNTPRNVSFYKIVVLIAMGGVLSLLVAIIGYDMPILGQLGPLSPGIIEEVAKLATVVLVVRQATRYKYILNGMLFGAAVGVGFAVFESAGYAFEHIQYSVDGNQLRMAFDQMSFVIYLRALLSPFGHVAWTAIAAAALWRVKKDQPLQLSMFVDPKFLKAFIIPVALHTLWDTPIPGGLAVGVIKWTTLGVISWYVVFAMVQQGLRQVKADQVRTTKLTLQSMQAVA